MKIGRLPYPISKRVFYDKFFILKVATTTLKFIQTMTCLGFAWKFPRVASIRYFVFTVLPFGLSSAPYIFTKCLKSLKKLKKY